VGYSIIKYYLNGVWISQLEHHKARKISADIIATFLPDDVVDGLYSSVELAGLEVAGLTLEPIAAIRVAIPEKFRLLNIAMIDIGAGTSDISITNDGSVIAFGMIPHAGDSLTEALAKACLIDFATAEQVKTAASEQDVIEYEDIMGTIQKITADEVLKICQPEINKMAHLTAEEIRKLNGGVSPSAVFIVGGGGKIKGLTEKVAEELGLDLSRVALRGEEIMKDIDFPKEAIKDSTIITPIGICLTHYDQSNNFIYVTFNGTKIKLYDNNRLTVMDAAMQASFRRESLFGKKGRDLRYTLNGIRHSIRGEFGESAQVYVNGENVSFNHPIRSNDKIKIEPSTVGKSGSLRLSDIEEYNNNVEITINGDKIELPVLAKVNGEYVAGNYNVKTNDKIEMPCDYTLGKVVEYMGLSPDNLAMKLNGSEADINYKVSANDVIELNERSYIHNYNRNRNFSNESSANEGYIFKNMTKSEKNLNDVSDYNINDSDKLLVIVNGKPIVMSGKESYSFVDVFDYIDFDTSKMQGKGIATIVNGEDAQYTQPLHVGDKIEIYWK
jgi:cell division ATPase FtsA